VRHPQGYDWGGLPILCHMPFIVTSGLEIQHLNSIEIPPIFLYFWFCVKRQAKVTSGPSNLMLQTMLEFHNPLIRVHVNFQWYILKNIGDILLTNQVLLPNFDTKIDTKF
jgi:hypothetical protein